MPNANSSVGINSTFALKLGAVWNTPTVCGANNGIMLTGESFIKDIESQTDESIGIWATQTSEPGAVTVAGSIEGYLRYDGMDLLFAQVCGSSSVYYQEATLLTSGTASGGSTTTLVHTGAGWTASAYVNKYLVVRTGTGKNQVLTITANTTDTLTFATATAPVSGDTYEISEYAPALVDECDGTASSTSVDILTNTMTTDAYLGKYVKIISGTGIDQVRRITTNDANTLTVASAWTTNPDATSGLEISGDTSRHIYDVTDEIFGLFMAFCVDDLINVKENASVKFNEFTIKGANVGAMSEFSFAGVGSTQNPNTTTGTNTLTTMGNVTVRENGNIALFKGANVTVRMNNQTAIALASGDSLTGVSSYEHTFTRNMRGVQLLGGSDQVDELTNDGKPSGSLKLTFERTKTAQNTYQTDWTANTPKKLDIVWTGNTITNVARSITFEFPHLLITKVEQPTVPGIKTTSLEMAVHGDADGNAVGMTPTQPMRITLINTYGGDPLQIGND